LHNDWNGGGGENIYTIKIQTPTCRGRGNTGVTL